MSEVTVREPCHRCFSWAWFSLLLQALGRRLNRLSHLLIYMMLLRRLSNLGPCLLLQSCLIPPLTFVSTTRSSEALATAP